MSVCAPIDAPPHEIGISVDIVAHVVQHDGFGIELGITLAHGLGLMTEILLFVYNKVADYIGAKTHGY